MTPTKNRSTWNADKPLPLEVAVEVYREDAMHEPLLFLAFKIGFAVVIIQPLTFAQRAARFLAGIISAMWHQ